MRSLARAAKAERGGASIPDVFSSLAGYQAHIRRAEVTMVAGPPGAGKSTFALVTALRAKSPTLYFSADSHAHTMALRTISALTATEQDKVEGWMEEDPQWAKDTLAHANHIRWNFDSSPGIEDIDEEIQVYREVMGADPHLIVVDNLIDVSFIDGDEYQSLRSLLRELKGFARDTGAAVLALHHTSESQQMNPCPPRSAIHGKVNQTPAMIMTLGATPGHMPVAVVKNRYGPADVSGTTAHFLDFDPSSMYLRDREAA
jgi:replicative DNA helicase